MKEKWDGSGKYGQDYILIFQFAAAKDKEEDLKSGTAVREAREESSSRTRKGFQQDPGKDLRNRSVPAAAPSPFNPRARATPPSRNPVILPRSNVISVSIELSLASPFFGGSSSGTEGKALYLRCKCQRWRAIEN